jgi:hypothetical protein
MTIGISKLKIRGSPAGNGRAPFIRAYIAKVSREEPVMALKVFHSVLPFAVDGFVQFLNDSRALVASYSA